MNTTNTDPTTSAGEREEPISVPALVKKARGELSTFLKNGAHVLCPLEVTDPPPGYAPKVVCTHINPDPTCKEVYLKDKGYGNKPDTFELSKVALMKMGDTLGVSWDHEKSRRTDNGSNPLECRYKVVGYVEDYLGRRKEISAEKTINLDAIKDSLIFNKQKIAESYQKKMGTKYEADIPKKWREAIAGNTVPELIASEVKSELILKRQFMVELAETGAKLRAIRDKGIRTSYTAEELKKPFVDVRMVPVDGRNRQAAERAYDHLYGKPPASQETSAPQGMDSHWTESPGRSLSESTVIDATARAATDDAPQESGNRSREQAMADFDACDRAEQIQMIMDLAKRRKFPFQLKSEEMLKWPEAQLRTVVIMVLDLPDVTQEGGRP